VTGSAPVVLVAAAASVSSSGAGQAFREAKILANPSVRLSPSFHPQIATNCQRWRQRAMVMAVTVMVMIREITDITILLTLCFIVFHGMNGLRPSPSITIVSRVLSVCAYGTLPARLTVRYYMRSKPNPAIGKRVALNLVYQCTIRGGF
jgi:hypothetical protein